MNSGEPLDEVSDKQPDSEILGKNSGKKLNYYDYPKTRRQ